MDHGFRKQAANTLWQLIDDTAMPRRKKSAARLAINRLADQKAIPRNKLLAEARRCVLLSKRKQDAAWWCAHRILQIVENFEFPSPKGHESERRLKLEPHTIAQRYKWLKFDYGHDVMRLSRIN